MKIIECCPFHKENLVARIHISESAKWVDEIHVTETNRTFQYSEKSYCFDIKHPKCFYHKVDTTKLFKKSRKTIPHIMPFKRSKTVPLLVRNTSWYHESVQRNLSVSQIDFNDSDILILSDIDEIINPIFADRIIEEVKKRKIITVRFHFTLFYFNLFSKSFAGPPDYSYRTTVLTGKEFRTRWKKDSDWLRKRGEAGKLYNDVYCPDEIMGFHHSWLGDEKFIKEKINAYAHIEQKKWAEGDYIRECLAAKKSIFPGHELELRPDIKLLDSVEQIKHTDPQYFL